MGIEKGILYGVGVGPGDPELMTLKAVRIIRECDVVILPSAPKETCYAYRIAAAAVPEIAEKEIICKPFPMKKEPEDLEEAHNRIFEELAVYLAGGKKVAFLTLGDPSVYSTYSYMHKRVEKQQGRAEMISGVPSFCAAAARLGIALGDSQEEIHIIPASYKIEETLTPGGTRIYMKSGRKLAELKTFLEQEQTSRKLQIYSISNCGMIEEKVSAGVENIDPDSGYLTIVIVKTLEAS